MNSHEFLYKVNIFELQNSDILQAISSIASEKKFAKDSHIYMVRDEVEFIYIVKSGVVATYGVDKNYNEKIFFLLNDGNIINDDCVVNAEASTSCYAFTDCELLCINKNDLLALMSNNQNVNHYIIQSITNKLTRCYRQLKNSSTTIGLDKKLCSKLWKLAKDYGYETPQGVTLSINVNTVFMAKMLGTTRETVSRTITKLCNNGILLMDKGKIIIKDKRKMMQYIKED